MFCRATLFLWLKKNLITFLETFSSILNNNRLTIAKKKRMFSDIPQSDKILLEI